MTDINKSEDALFETLTLRRDIIGDYGPPYGGFGGAHTHWSYGYGTPTRKEVWTNDKGQKHRIYGPAVTVLDKRYHLVEWYKEGELHRIDGPARVHNANAFWYKDGKLHCLCGPAVIEKAGPKQYWIEGQRLSPKEYKKEIARRKRKGLIK